MEWFLKVVRDNYANFEGRARRKEFWMFYLFYAIFGVVIGFLIGLLAGILDSPALIFLVVVYFIAMLIPLLAASVRRLHDTGKSGWMVLIYFIPLIGWIWLLVLLVTEGDRGENQYGPDPKGSGENIEEIGQTV